MVYDSTLNITWLADWNYAKTQFTATGGAQGDADGLMNWTAADAWGTIWFIAATAIGVCRLRST